MWFRVPGSWFQVGFLCPPGPPAEMIRALLHLSGPVLLCVALVRTSLFDGVLVDVSHEDYAEPRVEALPALLRMPCNSVVNLLYPLLGLYWLRRGGGIDPTTRYMNDVFGLMALLYGPLQWTRLALLKRAPAVLDQWVTLPIFAWVPAWIRMIERVPAERRVRDAWLLELCSLLSYGLALVHERGFEAALCVHVAYAVFMGVRVQVKQGDRRTRRFLLLAVVSCAGFVVLKLLDRVLDRFWLFQRLTGHFWSKVCDVLQFHFSFCFLNAHAHIAAHKD